MIYPNLTFTTRGGIVLKRINASEIKTFTGNYITVLDSKAIAVVNGKEITMPEILYNEIGVEYHFVDEEKLQKFQEEGKVIELRAYNTVHGVWKYFTVDDGQFDAEDNYAQNIDFN